MSSATVTVESVQRVEGISKASGKPYTKYVVHAANGGGEFATFDGKLCLVAEGLVKKRAVVEYEDSKFGKDLKAIRQADEQADDFRAVTSDGAADWDVIGLQKVRCALWKEILGPCMAAGLSLLPDDPNAADVSRLVATFGTQLRQIAEADIYSSKAPAQDGDWIGL